MICSAALRAFIADNAFFRVVSADTAESLRKRYRLPSQSFEVLLIGKDGHVELRSNKPVGAGELQGRIDAMPMRRAGQR